MISKAEKEFYDTNIQITYTGQKHLGAVIGTITYKNEHVKTKVKTWVRKIKLLSQTAVTEPHATYCAFVTGYKHNMTYYMRTIPEISELLTPLYEVIRLPIFADISNKEYVNSIKVTNELTEFIIKQNPKYEVNVKLLNEEKIRIDFSRIFV